MYKYFCKLIINRFGSGGGSGINNLISNPKFDFCRRKPNPDPGLI